MRFRPLFALIPVLVAALALAAQGINVRRVPKEGETHAYRMNIAFSMFGTDASYNSLLTEKVLKVEADGSYAVETTQSEYTARFDSEEMPLPAEDLARSVRTLSPSGEVLKLQAEITNDSAYRLSNLDVFRPSDKPVNVGDTWKVELKPNVEQGTKAATADYKVEAAEKVGDADTLQISFTYKETEGTEPASAEGKFWIRTSDAVIAKMDAEWKNAPIAGAQGAVTAKVSYLLEK